MTAYDPNNAYNDVQNAAGEWVRPAYGIGYGGQGSWMNQHFATIEEAEIAFSARVTQLRRIYTAGKSTRRNETSDICPSHLLCRFTICNVRSDGTKGKIRQTVQLYGIPA